ASSAHKTPAYGVLSGELAVSGSRVGDHRGTAYAAAGPRRPRTLEPVDRARLAGLAAADRPVSRGHTAMPDPPEAPACVGRQSLVQSGEPARGERPPGSDGPRAEGVAAEPPPSPWFAGRAAGEGGRRWTPPPGAPAGRRPPRQRSGDDPFARERR